MIILKSSDANEPTVTLWSWFIGGKRPQKLGILAITTSKIDLFETFQLICDPGRMYISEYFLLFLDPTTMIFCLLLGGGQKCKSVATLEY